jgi:predicted RNA-binding protein (virulence factor B family)
MNEKIKIGEINSLKLNRVSEPGVYLIAADEEEVLLPNIYVTKTMAMGSIIDVFVYTDSEDRPVATTLKPYAKLGEIAFLEIVDSAKFGYFLDMGLPKDLLLPKNRTKKPFSIGERAIVQLQLDEKTNRLIASQKYILEKKITGLERKDEVEVMVYSKTPLGFKVIVNNLYEGMIFHNEIFENVSIGDKKRAYVKTLRSDNKLDITLQKIGEKVKDNEVYEILVQNGGKLDFTYKSDSTDIKEMFGVSKKSFKATLTKLIQEGKIILDETSIRVKS